MSIPTDTNPLKSVMEMWLDGYIASIGLMREYAVEKGVKFDNDKLRWDLLPRDALEELVKVYTLGAKKYGDNNYLNGMDWSRIIGALERHLTAFIKGETHDKEDGQHHLASVVWNALTLLTYDLRKIPNDNIRIPPGIVE